MSKRARRIGRDKGEGVSWEDEREQGRAPHGLAAGVGDQLI